MTYNLGSPPGLVAGDVLLFEPGLGNTLSDVIRFNPAGTGGNNSYPNALVFYSDTQDSGEAPAPADTGFPISFYANTVNVRESGFNTHVATYTPFAGQPGFVQGFTVTYNFVSSTAVPEPGPLVLAGLASVLGLAAVRFRRKAAAA